MSARPSGTVTLLFTDVEGSTKLLHELGAERYAAALAEHRRLIREACSSHGGVEVDTQGDAFFFAFPSAPGALEAARAFTESLSDGPIRVRVGLHTGTPLLTAEGYVGDDVHFAARVAASSHGGQVVLSAATVHAVNASGSEPQALRLLDLGEHRLKDVSEAVPIFQLGEESFPPLKTISNTNLPRPASSFVGRETELAEVLSRFEQGARLLTLTGAGGSGKTRLALEAAASLVPEYKAGVFWVGLAALRDPALVTETISQTLGAKDGLAEHIGERELLLLLDNLEQVVEAAPELASLLERCPNLTLLVTSRELLRVRGEVEYPVPPLAAPEAVSLFCERSALEPSAEVAELCARLDSLPLAVELAAARTKALTVSQILERLAQRLDLLRGGRDADPRQQTLRATIEWSYDLLSPEEQRLFARLSVFAGGCTLEAAEEVADADLDTLQSLVEKSLVRFTNERYWMLETIREYAAERVATQRAELQRRHAEFVLRWYEAGKSAPDWARRAVLERDNLRSTIAWTLASGEAEMSLILANAYGNLCAFHGSLGEARRWLDAALEIDGSDRSSSRLRALRGAAWLAQQQGDLESSRGRAEEALALARALGDLDATGGALSQLAVISGDLKDYDRCERLFDEALQHFRKSGNDREVRDTLGLVGFLHLARGDHAKARPWIEEALSVSELAGDEHAVFVNSINLGDLEAREGRLERAVRLYQRALALRDAVGVASAFTVLDDVGWVAAARGDFTVAAVLLAGCDALAESTEVILEPVQREKHAATARRIERALEGAELASSLEHGRTMTFEELVAYANEFIDSTG